MALRNRLDDHNAPLRRSKWHFAKSRANARTVLDLSRPWSTGEVLALLSRRGTPDRTVYWRRARRQATSEPSRLHRRQARPPSLAAPFPRELFSTAVRLKFKTTGEKFGSSGEQTMTAHIMRFSGLRANPGNLRRGRFWRSACQKGTEATGGSGLLSRHHRQHGRPD